MDPISQLLHCIRVASHATTFILIAAGTVWAIHTASVYLGYPLLQLFQVLDDKDAKAGERKRPAQVKDDGKSSWRTSLFIYVFMAWILELISALAAGEFESPQTAPESVTLFLWLLECAAARAVGEVLLTVYALGFAADKYMTMAW